jgi:hypothetical protein
MRVASCHLVWAVSGSLVVFLAGCDNPSSSNMAVALQPSDLQPTRLSAAERRSHTAECMKTWKGSVTYSAKGTTSVMSEGTAERMCDCFVDRVEDRTNKIEFLLVMQVIIAMQDTRAANSPIKDPASLHSLKAGMKNLEAGASKIGVTAPRFQEMVVRARDVGEPAMMQCNERVTSKR